MSPRISSSPISSTGRHPKFRFSELTLFKAASLPRSGVVETTRPCNRMYPPLTWPVVSLLTGSVLTDRISQQPCLPAHLVQVT
jgi:hypothetical protein